MASSNLIFHIRLMATVIFLHAIQRMVIRWQKQTASDPVGCSSLYERLYNCFLEAFGRAVLYEKSYKAYGRRSCAIVLYERSYRCASESIRSKNLYEKSYKLEGRTNGCFYRKIYISTYIEEMAPEFFGGSLFYSTES